MRWLRPETGARGVSKSAKPATFSVAGSEASPWVLAGYSKLRSEAEKLLLRAPVDW